MSFPTYLTSTYLTDNARTTDEMKAAVGDWLDGCKRLPGGDPEAVTLTSSETIEVSAGYMVVSLDAGTERDLKEIIGATDEMDREGALVTLYNPASNWTITVKHLHDDGNIVLEGGNDFEMVGNSPHITLQRNAAGYWIEVNRCFGSSSGAMTRYAEHLGIAPATDPTFSGIVTVDADGKIRILNIADASVFGSAHGFQLGPDSQCLKFDTNEIQAVVSGAASALQLNPSGGTVSANSYPVLTTNDEGHGNGIDADTVDGLHADDIAAAATIGAAYAAISYRGTSTPGGLTGGGATWTLRAINSEDADDGAFVTGIESDGFYLENGRYVIYARAAGYKVNRHKIRLQKYVGSWSVVQDLNSNDIVGTPEVAHAAITGSSYGGQTYAELRGAFDWTQAGYKLGIGHACETSNGTDGQGIPTGITGDDVFLLIEIWKLG
jgi:hypothetical protein